MDNTAKQTIHDLQLKLYEKLKPSGWADVLKSFLLSEDFKNIIKQLIDDVGEGNRFTPPLGVVFRAFEECPYKDLKLVMLGQDPFPKINAADGIAFSCSNKTSMEASLRYIFAEIERTVYKDTGYDESPDLKRWSNQGILMLNTALTTRINKIGSHYEIWKPFTSFLLDLLNSSCPGIIYTFIGAKAKEWESLIVNGQKLYCSHPASAAYAKRKEWDSDDIFNRINQVSKGLFNTEFTW